MKPASLAAGALAIAITFGTGGYFLGKSHSPSPAGEASAAASGTPRTATGVAKRPQLPSVDPVELRAKLDAEQNPLKRFDLALQHLEAWIAKNPKDALDWLASQEPSGRRDDVIREALAQFAEQDAGAAADIGLEIGRVSGEQEAEPTQPLVVLGEEPPKLLVGRHAGSSLCAAAMDDAPARPAVSPSSDLSARLATG